MTPEEAKEWVYGIDPLIVAVRVFNDGMYAAVKRLLFHYTIIYGAVGDEIGYDDRWCYTDDLVAAVQALAAWDYPTQKEPEGWQRNPRTSRRRPDGRADMEYLDD